MTGATLQTEHKKDPAAGVISSLRVGGRLTYHDAPAVRDSIMDEVAATEATKVVLELSGIDEIDTSGAAVLVEALRAGQRSGKRVLLCSPSESVLRMFRLAGFEDVLEHCCSTPGETYQRLLN